MNAYPSKPVIVIGGGIAGLAAALELKEGGKDVVLLERAKDVGGRAYSWQHDGFWIGNSNHHITGWHANIRSLIARVGGLDALVDHPGSAVLSKGRGPSRRRVPLLPGPLSKLGKHFQLYPSFRLQDRFSARTVAALLASSQGERLEELDEVSLHAWGIGFNTSMRPFLHHILDPYSLHALNVAGYSISARTAACVMRLQSVFPEPFTSTFERSVQADLIEPLKERFLSRGGIIRTSVEVRQLVLGVGRIDAVHTNEGRIEGSDFVIAVPPDRLVAMLPPEFLRYHYFRNISKLHTRAQASLLLCFEEPIIDFDEPTVVAESELGLYFRSVNATAKRTRHGATIACVLSRYEAFNRLPDQKLAQMAVGELQSVLPHLRPQWLQGWKLVRNDQAPTLLHSTGSWQLRPRVRSPLPNLKLAGDWVRHPIDLANLEGAAYSGLLAAEEILEAHSIECSGPIDIDSRSGMQLLGRVADTAELPRRAVRRLMARTDRRKFPRPESALEGYLEDAESHIGWSPIHIYNLSYQGLFFVTEASPRVRARVRLRIRSPRGEHLELRGRIIWVEEVRGLQGGGIGVGVRVRAVDDASDELWEMLSHTD